MRRIPLWFTLVPLVVGIGIYWSLWTGWAGDFKAALTPWLPGATIEITGFPYRLEANVTDPRITAGDTVKLGATAQAIRLNRGPWRPELTVVEARQPRFSAIVGPALASTIAGKAAQISIKVENATENGVSAPRLSRLSAVIESATARLGVTSATITADTLELHLRERIPGPSAPTTAPTGPPRGQLVITGKATRFAAGDPLALAADITATGAARLLAYDAWATTGTLEITGLTLSDANGEIASARATLTPVGRTGIRFAGTVSTVCPASIAAALQALPPVSELRLRAPVTLAFEGVAGAVRVTGIPANIATRPTRGQLPPCPMVRGTG